ncbi:MAG: hypothetical protein ACRDAP_20140, partial [Shewanella sp.]
MYYDTAIDDFYGFQMKSNYGNPDQTLSTRTDWLTAKVLAAVDQKVELPAVHLGLAMGELSVYRQLSSAQAETPYLRALENLHHDTKQTADGRNKFTSLNKALQSTQLELGGGDGLSFSPKLSPLSKLMSDGAPLSQRGQGACSLLATSAAYEMKIASEAYVKLHGGGAPDAVNAKALKQILYKLETLDSTVSNDPSKAYRMIEGLTRVNEELQEDFRKVVNPKKKSTSVTGALKYIAEADDPVVLTFRNVDNTGDAHVISVSKVVSAGARNPNERRTTYLVMDGNLGAVPCATLDQAQQVVQISANRFLGQDPTNTNFGAMRVSAYQM